MAFMNWRDAYSVKVEELDAQHKKLAGMVNALHHSILDGKDEASKGMLGPMIEAMQHHFRSEEKYMDQFGFSEALAHKQEHAQFANHVLDVKKGVDAGELIVTLEIANLLRGWFEKHLLESDKRYVDCFAKNGLK